MKKYRYWFTTEDGESACEDFIGTYISCEAYAQEVSDKIGKDIYINCENDIVGIVCPDTCIY